MSSIASSSQVSADRRRFKKIPVFIVENHNDVLELILPSLARRYLPLQNNLMIHFDSHPDMCVPRQMSAQTVFNRQTLLESLSIENWIIPLMYGQYLGPEIVWVAPPWAHQIPAGHHALIVGECDDKIKVNSNLDYFLSDGCCEDDKKMSNQKRVSIHVTQASDESMNELIRDDWILDVDLDYFSTLNPFLNIYPKASTYEKLRVLFKTEKVYDVNDPVSVLAYQQRRNHDLDFFEKIFQHMAQNGSLEKFKNEDASMSEKFELAKQLIDDLCRHYSIYDIDWFIINDAGCTCDDEELQIPHHESTEDTIKELLTKFEKFLKSVKVPPSMVTIARSCEDGYTPAHQVEFIQSEVLRTLRNVFGENLGDEVLWYKNPPDCNFSVFDLVEPKKKLQTKVGE